jgi:uncharacterized membrane protein YvbJ
MYCSKCGCYNSDDSINCKSCGSELQTGPNNQNNFNGQQTSNNQGGSNFQNQYPNHPNNQYCNTQEVKRNVPNYLVYSILATIFCCIPFGIPAIVFSTQVDKYLGMGDYNKAEEASKKSKMFCLIALFTGLAVWFVYFFAIVASQM